MFIVRLRETPQDPCRPSLKNTIAAFFSLAASLFLSLKTPEVIKIKTQNSKQKIKTQNNIPNCSSSRSQRDFVIATRRLAEKQSLYKSG